MSVLLHLSILPSLISVNSDNLASTSRSNIFLFAAKTEENKPDVPSNRVMTRNFDHMAVCL